MGTKLTSSNLEQTHSEEIAQARDFYRNTVLPTLKAQGNAIDGHMIVVDYANCDYEIAATDVEAMDSIRERHPESFLWIERIGYKTAYAIGGGSVRDD